MSSRRCSFALTAEDSSGDRMDCIRLEMCFVQIWHGVVDRNLERDRGVWNMATGIWDVPAGSEYGSGIWDVPAGSGTFQRNLEHDRGRNMSAGRKNYVQSIAAGVLAILLCVGQIPGGLMKALGEDRLANEGTSNENITDETGLEQSAGHETGSDEADQYEPKAEEVCITIPGLDKEYTLLWVSDMHICTGKNDPDVSADHADEVDQRREMFCSESGRQSSDTWKLLSDQIDNMGADYVIFGADMVDYASRENLGVLQYGISRISTPWMYIRADHDYARWYGSMEIEQMRELHREIAPQNKIWIERFDGFTLVGLDNTTYAVSEETLAQLQEVCEEGIPIILCTHVPFDTGSDDAQKLAGISKECWGDRVLCWGDGDEYNTAKAPTMKAILDMIMAPDSPIRAVLAGHLHASWDGSLTDTCMGHVFSAAFEDYVGIIKVSG